MRQMGRPQGQVRRALQAALDAGLAAADDLAIACGIPRERAQATLKEIHRARRRRRPAGHFDALAHVRQAWR